MLMIEAHPVPPHPVIPCPAHAIAQDRGHAVSSAEPMVLFEALRPAVNLALWHRALPGTLAGSRLARLMAHAPFCLTAEAAPERAVDAIAEQLPTLAPVDLLLDIQQLAMVFAAIIERETVAVRLEAITGRGCHRWHADAIGLRLLTTYRGPGTEWLGLAGGGAVAATLGAVAPPPGTVQAMPTGAVALLKGEGFPGNAGAGCIHRAPQSTRGPRARLLLCLDEPGRIPCR